MLKKSALITILLVIILLFSACAAPAATTQPPAMTEAPKPEPTATTAPSVTQAPAGVKKLILATTTSTQDSGLLDYLLPILEQETGIKAEVIAVGTGQAITLGEDGNADVLLGPRKIKRR